MDMLDSIDFMLQKQKGLLQKQEGLIEDAKASNQSSFADLNRLKISLEEKVHLGAQEATQNGTGKTSRHDEGNDLSIKEAIFFSIQILASLLFIVFYIVEEISPGQFTAFGLSFRTIFMNMFLLSFSLLFIILGGARGILVNIGFTAMMLALGVFIVSTIFPGPFTVLNFFWLPFSYVNQSIFFLGFVFTCLALYMTD